VVAGTNFGCGSSREHAPIALINMGASAVLADSFARIFFRNGINLGLPLIVCKGIAKHVKDGQTVHLDILKGTVTIQETGEILQAEALGDKAMEILSAGGIKPMMRAKYGR
jgi:3-isopropylmalate dehydratase small subunit